MPDTSSLPPETGVEPVATADLAAELIARQLVMDSAMLAFLALALALPVYAVFRMLGKAPLQFGKIDAQPLRAVDLLVACGMIALLLVMIVGAPPPGVEAGAGGAGVGLVDDRTATDRPETVAAPGEEQDPGGEIAGAVGETSVGEEHEVEQPDTPRPRVSGLALWFSALFWGTVCLAVVVYLGGLRGIALPAWLGLSRMNPLRALGLAVVALIVALPVIIVANAAFQFFVIQPKFPELGVQEAVQLFMTSSDLAVKIALVVSAVIVAPIAEELLFRGFLYPAIKRFTDPVFAMVCSGLLFAAVHNNLPALVPLLVLGIAFAMAYEYSGSLWVPIWMHALFNLTNLTIMLMAPQLADPSGVEQVESPDPVATRIAAPRPSFAHVDFQP